MKIFSLLLFFAFTAFAASLANSFLPGEWYSLLDKPSWALDDKFFVPFWGGTYFLFAIAAWKLWLEKHPIGPRALGWWLVQLILSASWAWVFFGLYRPGMAFIVISVLMLVMSITIRWFKRISLSATTWLTPGLVWVAYLWCFNLSIVWLNGARTVVYEIFGYG